MTTTVRGLVQESQEQGKSPLRNDFSLRGRVQSAGSILLHPMQATRIRIGSAGLLVNAGAGSLPPPQRIALSSAKG
jgi:hypothetical protein